MFFNSLIFHFIGTLRGTCTYLAVSRKSKLHIYMYMSCKIWFWRSLIYGFTLYEFWLPIHFILKIKSVRGHSKVPLHLIQSNTEKSLLTFVHHAVCMWSNLMLVNYSCLLESYIVHIVDNVTENGKFVFRFITCKLCRLFVLRWSIISCQCSFWAWNHYSFHSNQRWYLHYWGKLAIQ